jgi:hypothetical protein
MERIGRFEIAIAAGLFVVVALEVGELARLPHPAPPLPPPDLTRSSAPANYAAPGAVRAQMLAARDGAAQAKGPRLAPQLWASAVDTQREAEAALSGQDFDRAQALFGDAEKTYHQVWRRAAALMAAREARLAGLRREARAVELAAETARRDAEREYQRVALAARLVTADELAEERFAALARPALLDEAARGFTSPIFWAATTSDTR